MCLDSITLILKQEGFDNFSSSGGIHLARSLIDRVLAEKDLLEESRQNNNLATTNGP
jgi:hypothetical protein